MDAERSDAEHPLKNWRDAERIRLVQADLAQTNDFIKGVVGTSATFRGAASTISLALIGIAIQQRLIISSLCAALVVTIFWVLDGYHGWLYREALLHAKASEGVLVEYFNTISRAADKPVLVTKFQGRLRAHRVGLSRSFHDDFRIRDVWNARPTLVYRLLYPLLLALALIATAFMAHQPVSASPAPTHVIVDQVPSSTTHTSPPPIAPSGATTSRHATSSAVTPPSPSTSSTTEPTGKVSGQ